jgi:hypothetical protein
VVAELRDSFKLAFKLCKFRKSLDGFEIACDRARFPPRTVAWATAIRVDDEAIKLAGVSRVSSVKRVI